MSAESGPTMSSHVVDRQRNRYPFCVVWTPLPVLRWVEQTTFVPNAVDSLSYLAPRFPASSLPFLFYMLSRNVTFLSLPLHLPSLLPSLSSFLFFPLPFPSYMPTLTSPPPCTLLLPSPLLLPVGSSRSLATWVYAHPVELFGTLRDLTLSL